MGGTYQAKENILKLLFLSNVLELVNGLNYSQPSRNSLPRQAKVGLLTLELLHTVTDSLMHGI
jgi:hypothetical protein